MFLVECVVVVGLGVDLFDVDFVVGFGFGDDCVRGGVGIGFVRFVFCVCVLVGIFGEYI